MRALCVVAGVAAAVAACAGCASLTAEDPGIPPPQPIDVLAVGAFAAADRDDQRIARLLRRDVVAVIADAQAFPRLLDPAPAVLPHGAVVLSGELLEAEDGSEVLRLLIGPGIGAPRLRARYALHSAEGALLARFVQTGRSYRGAGYGAHWSPVYLDDLTEDFAAETAAAVIAWSRGEPLE